MILGKDQLLRTVDQGPLMAMTEPKKRGPKPKCPECGQKEGHYDDCPVGMGVAPKDEPPKVNNDAEILRRQAQGYAMRVWSGQSISLPRAERIRRVQKALEGQNLPYEGVTLP